MESARDGDGLIEQDARDPMKTVILAGGLGTRLAEETQVKPKPMVEIGGKPMLWHLMNIYAAHGFSEFIVALGYKGELVKEYFLNFYALNNDLTIDLSAGDTTGPRHCENLALNSMSCTCSVGRVAKPASSPRRSSRGTIDRSTPCRGW